MIHFYFCDDVHKPNLCMITDHFWFKENYMGIAEWCLNNDAKIHMDDPKMILFPDEETKMLFLLSWS